MSTDELATLSNTIQTNFVSYVSTYPNFINARNYFNELHSQNNSIIEKAEKSKETISTNYRKTYYEQQAIESVSAFYKFFIFLYVVAVIVTVYILSTKEGTSLLMVGFVFVLCVAYPFISVMLFHKLIELWHTFSSILPSSVYH